MTHYKMSRLHLGGGESLSTCYRRNEKAIRQDQDSTAKTVNNKKAKSTRQARES